MVITRTEKPQSSEKGGAWKGPKRADLLRLALREQPSNNDFSQSNDVWTIRRYKQTMASL